MQISVQTHLIRLRSLHPHKTHPGLGLPPGGPPVLGSGSWPAPPTGCPGSGSKINVQDREWQQSNRPIHALAGCNLQLTDLGLNCQNLQASGEMGSTSAVNLSRISENQERKCSTDIPLFPFVFFHSRRSAWMSTRSDVVAATQHLPLTCERQWLDPVVVKGVSLLTSGCCSTFTTLNPISGVVTNRCTEFVVTPACRADRAMPSPTLRTFPPGGWHYFFFFQKKKVKG